MAISEENRKRIIEWGNTGAGIGRAFAGQGSWADARKMYDEGSARMFPAPAGLTMEMVDLNGVPSRLVTPERLVDDRVVFYMHGGGYVHGGLNAQGAIYGNLANRLGARVYVPDYRQAPEFQFPIPIQDTFKAYQAVLDAGQNPSSIALAGDSAGGAMVITIMRWLKRANLPLPAAGVAISPWADLAHTGISAKTRDGLDGLGAVEFLDKLARIFLGSELATDPDASPMYADVRGLAPILIQMGENEVMLSGGVKLAENLADQRVRTTLEVWPGMFHVWHAFANYMPEADEAIDNAVAFIAKEFERHKKG